MKVPVMFKRFAIVIGCLLTLAAPAAAAPSKDHARDMAAGMKLFAEHVRPILLQNCFECHGGRKIKSELDMIERRGLLKGGEHGPVVVPGDAEASLLYRFVAHLEKPHMPYRRDRLPDEAIEKIKQWINLGAPYDKPLGDVNNRDLQQPGEVTDLDREYWAFAPLTNTLPPQVKNDAWSRTPIDHFILKKLRDEKLKPNPIADRRTLIRRAYFDLIGLPPTPEEVEAFVNDPDPDAYEKLIDRLLDKPGYGERWARHFFDVARFAESAGYEQDYHRPHAYHYRDFVIRALNQDMPYDRFASWQIAGDELAPENPLAMMATGFLGAGAFPTQLTEKEFESARYTELDDMAQAVGASFLGLTIGCARCHDHKYDPIPDEDYYDFVANFTTAIRSDVEIDLSSLKPPPPNDGAEPSKVMIVSENVKPRKHHADGRGFPHFYPTTYRLSRGDVNQKLEPAEPGYLQVLMRGGKTDDYWKIEPPKDATTSYRRASLANWLTDEQFGAGHLMARVVVNRLWHHHLGRGIVATPIDFGHQSPVPSHPELLDWLANNLIENGWTLKRIHKLIMTSSVYMQNADADKAREKIDPENHLLWRWTPRRLEAEPIRDAMLAVSGQLDRRMFGPGTLNESMNRRSVYFQIKRSQLIPMMMLFDWPEHLVPIGSRNVTTIAPQALALMNNPQVRDYARAFAQRIAASDDPITAAYRLALGRKPAPDEHTQAERFITRQTESYRGSGHAQPEQAARIDFCQAVFAFNEFVYIN